MIKGRKMVAVTSLLLGLILILVAIGCAAEEEETPTPTLTPTPTPTAAPTEVLKIGVSTPLTGPAALVGVGLERGAQIAADEINDAGGLTVGDTDYQIEIVTRNDEATSEGGVSAATWFAANDVNFVIGPIISDAYMGAAATYETNEIVVQHFASAFTATEPEKPFSFRAWGGAVGVLGGFYSWLPTSEFWTGVETVYMLNPDDSSGHETEPSVRNAILDNGFEVVGNDFIPYPADAPIVVEKVLAKNPDVIDMGVLTTGHAAPILTELYNQGYEGKTICMSAQPPGILVNLIGAETIEGVVVWAGTPGGVSDEYDAFYNEYVERYEETPMMIAALHPYMAVYSYVMAIEAADSLDTAAVRDALADLEWESPYGPAKWGGEELFGIKRQLICPVYFSHFVDGELVIVGSTDPVFYAPIE